MARLLDVVVDCAHPGTLARFRAQVRLVALRARVRPEQPGQDLVVLQDPQGNEFCLQQA